MYDKLSDPVPISSIAAAIGYIFKYGRENVDEKNSIQIFNIFQKASRVIDESTKVWLAHSLLMAFEYSNDKITREMLKTCLPFILILHLRCKEGNKAVIQTNFDAIIHPLSQN